MHTGDSSSRDLDILFPLFKTEQGLKKETIGYTIPTIPEVTLNYIFPDKFLELKFDNNNVPTEEAYFFHQPYAKEVNFFPKGSTVIKESGL